jgi:hypothetical protein
MSETDILHSLKLLRYSRLLSRLTDGGELVIRAGRRPFTPKKIPGTRFC